MPPGFEVEAQTELEPWAREALDQQDAADHAPAQEAAPAAEAQRSRLPPDQVSLLERMVILEPGDARAIANLLEMHPEIRDEIVARAQEVVGNDTVAKALELIQNQGAAPAAPAAEAAAAPPDGEAAVEAAAAINHPAAETKPAEEFIYELSPLALQYERSQQVIDHVEYIRNHPELRDKILISAAEFDPELAAEVRKALEAQAPVERAPAEQAPTEAAAPAVAAEPTAQVEAFIYVVSPLALQYDRAQQVIDHVDFIRNNPALRDAVLGGAAEFDPQLAEEVRAALAQGVATSPTIETEPTPPAVVKASAEEAAPAPSPEAAPVQDAAAQAEPGWVTRARAYHQDHAENAARFNQITGGVCLGADGTLDPNLVANWQVEHGVEPDGRVGRATLAAATEAPVAPVAAAEPTAEAIV